MNSNSQLTGGPNLTILKWLTFLMFMMFAMTTDAVGVIIPEVMKQFQVGMTAAGLMHYTPMIAIALAGVLLGFLADKLGRKVTIILGLAMFAVNSYLYIVANTFGMILCLMAIGGLSIGVFKTGALALIGDISKSMREHTSTMNTVEGFFAVGAIIGPFIVTYFLTRGTAWQWLYVVAGTLCVILVSMALLVDYPKTIRTTERGILIKSGFMVGLGETTQQIYATMRDLKAAYVDFLTIGQYLQPTRSHVEVKKYYTPGEFGALKNVALRVGFTHVESGPLVRSSYHAQDAFR